MQQQQYLELLGAVDSPGDEAADGEEKVIHARRFASHRQCSASSSGCPTRSRRGR
jgi:hypothetical protein